MKRWIPTILAALAAVLLTGVLLAYQVDVRKSQQRSSAMSIYVTCVQLERVKEQIRGSVKDSITRLPDLEYYVQHPAELKQAVADSALVVERFAPLDCNELPTVRRYR